MPRQIINIQERSAGGIQTVRCVQQALRRFRSSTVNRSRFAESAAAKRQSTVIVPSHRRVPYSGRIQRRADPSIIVVLRGQCTEQWERSGLLRPTGFARQASHGRLRLHRDTDRSTSASTRHAASPGSDRLRRRCIASHGHMSCTEDDERGPPGHREGTPA